MSTPALEKLPITVNGKTVSHIAAWLERPAPETDGVDGLAVLYMHGFGSDQSGTKGDFFRQRFLNAGIAFCSFDFQGHGESGGGMFDLSLTRNISDIARVHGFLRAQGFERLLLMGSSMGGGSALWYAANHPEDVAAAVHIAPSMELHEGLMRWVGPENTKKWEREGRILFEHELVSCELSWNLIEDLRSFRMDRLKTNYRTPTLIFQGKKDRSVPWDKVVDFVVGCEYEGLELHLMADADHRLLDRLDHVWRSLHQYLVTQELVNGAA